MVVKWHTECQVLKPGILGCMNLEFFIQLYPSFATNRLSLEIETIIFNKTGNFHARDENQVRLHSGHRVE